ncbi:MAG: Asp-tRNA(Asn)/Glu-tRNA(Gln) amidotransferase subunit GatB, partial [Patescibacteria group bacterium]
MSTAYKTILGLETHIELKTKQKMFCGCNADYFGQEPNTHTCPVCLGLPGALPVPNKEAIVNTIMIGLALNCKINLETYFERKHYFYPDLPKGYQISQYQKPFCYDGYLDIGAKKIKIQRIHLEEDTGKLIHGLQGTDTHDSFVDFNRSSVPLVEIVTEPNVESSEDASLYLQKLQLTIRYLGLSDCDMEKGSMRCEPNISLKPLSSRIRQLAEFRDPDSSELPNYKVEVKNINSFKFVRKAIEYEVERQSEALEKGKTLVQETRRYIESTGKTETMRTKESSEDYRYFPEPDIPPIVFEQSEIDEIQKELSTKELPGDRYKKLIRLDIKPDIA